MRINFNPSAAIGVNNIHSLEKDLSKSLKRLSTGLRVNSASDDAAGLSISEKLRTQVRGDSQAARNVDDAVALIQVAEGALNEISNLLQRQRELAIQASNDTLTTIERGYIQQESQALNAEIDRINSATEYNGIKVLEGSISADLSNQIYDGLKQTWLEDGLARVVSAYSGGGVGLDVPGAGSIGITVSLDDGGAYAAYVLSSGPGNDMELHINAESYSFSGGYDAATNQDG
jgi:flagellin-like hook-associated protein FlgL